MNLRLRVVTCRHRSSHFAELFHIGAIRQALLTTVPHTYTRVIQHTFQHKQLLCTLSCCYINMSFLFPPTLTVRSLTDIVPECVIATAVVRVSQHTNHDMVNNVIFLRTWILIIGYCQQKESSTACLYTYPMVPSRIHPTPTPPHPNYSYSYSNPV